MYDAIVNGKSAFAKTRNAEKRGVTVRVRKARDRSW